MTTSVSLSLAGLLPAERGQREIGCGPARIGRGRFFLNVSSFGTGRGEEGARILALRRNEFRVEDEVPLPLLRLVTQSVNNWDEMRITKGREEKRREEKFVHLSLP